jgi:hypothetical protein
VPQRNIEAGFGLAQAAEVMKGGAEVVKYLNEVGFDFQRIPVTGFGLA